MRRPVPGPSRYVACLAILLIGLSACGDDGGTPTTEQDPDERLVEIYSATVEAIAAHDRPAPDPEDGSMTTLFLQAREDTEITAEVQVGVVNELDDWANVRFIDDLEEAVDVDADGAPVRDDGLLIGLGAVTDGAVTATLTADSYESEELTLVFDVSLRRRAGTWEVEGPLEGVRVPNP